MRRFGASPRRAAPKGQNLHLPHSTISRSCPTTNSISCSGHTNPCFLSADHDGSLLSRLADDIEEAQLDSGEQVLAGARAVLGDAKAGERAVRFALSRATESLEDVLRIAVSRGERIPHPVA
ncbi:hypothetical protein ACFWR9_34950 [Streptomyces sp. NPDC058534]|uniref:hypothetical protein n=1 Tax=Streptomyces sp. NPDC058534 TaxID=3346541 RepID=UPI00365D718D